MLIAEPSTAYLIIPIGFALRLISLARETKPTSGPNQGLVPNVSLILPLFLVSPAIVCERQPEKSCGLMSAAEALFVNLCHYP